MTPGEVAYRLNYEVSPITLVDGSAGALPGGALGINSLLLGPSFNGLLLPGDGGPGLDAFPVTFIPLPGSTLIDNQIATYPLANQAVAANAIINQPLAISMLMRIPASRIIGGYGGKQAVLQALQATLADHVTNEGTFVVSTPGFPWLNLILLRLFDASGGETKQPQIEYKWDFVQPLIPTGAGGNFSLNSVMSAIAGGGVTDGTFSGLASVIGNPATVASPPVIPNNVPAPGASLASNAALPGAAPVAA